MKRLFLFILLTVAIWGTAMAQYQPKMAADMTDFLGQVVQASEKNGDVVIHSECGIFSIRSSHLATFTTRSLDAGHNYSIILFTDKMIPNFKLVLWRLDGGTWVRVDSSDQDLARAKNLNSLGDMETINVRPSASKDYAFQLVSMSGKNETGRYGLVVQDHESGSGSSSGGSSGGNDGERYSPSNGKNADHYFKTKGYKWAYLKTDPQTKKTVLDGTWQASEEEGLFVANEGKKDFRQLQPASLASTSTINSVTTPNGITAFNLTHSSGTAVTVEVDPAKQTLTIWSKSNGRDYVIVYTLTGSYYQ